MPQRLSSSQLRAARLDIKARLRAGERVPTAEKKSVGFGGWGRYARVQKLAESTARVEKAKDPTRIPVGTVLKTDTGKAKVVRFGSEKKVLSVSKPTPQPDYYDKRTSPFLEGYQSPSTPQSYFFPEQRIETEQDDTGKVVGITDFGAGVSQAAPQGSYFPQSDIDYEQRRRQAEFFGFAQQERHFRELSQAQMSDTSGTFPLLDKARKDVAPMLPGSGKPGLLDRYKSAEAWTSDFLGDMYRKGQSKGIITREFAPPQRNASKTTFLDMPFIQSSKFGKGFTQNVAEQGERFSINYEKGLYSGIKEQPLKALGVGAFAIGTGFAGTALSGGSALVAQGTRLGLGYLGIRYAGSILEEGRDARIAGKFTTDFAKSLGQRTSTELIPGAVGGAVGQQLGNPVKYGLRRLHKNYVSLDDAGLKVTASTTEPYKLNQILALQGKEVKGVHASYTNLFPGLKSEFTVKAIPGMSKGFRSKIGQFSLYKSLPAKDSGLSQVYGGYIGITGDSSLSGSSPTFRFSLTEPKQYAYIFTGDTLAKVSPAEWLGVKQGGITGGKSIMKYQLQPSQSGKSFIAAENLLKMSSEGQYVSPVGSKIKLIDNKQFTIYTEPSKIKIPFLRWLQEKTKLGLEQTEIKLVNVESIKSLIPTVPTGGVKGGITDLRGGTTTYYKSPSSRPVIALSPSSFRSFLPKLPALSGYKPSKRSMFSSIMPSVSAASSKPISSSSVGSSGSVSSLMSSRSGSVSKPSTSRSIGSIMSQPSKPSKPSRPSYPNSMFSLSSYPSVPSLPSFSSQPSRPSYPSYPSIPSIPSKVPPIPKFNFDFEYKEKPSKRKGKKIGFRTRYTPSLEANIFQIKGKVGKRKSYTGLELRRIKI